MKKRSVRTVKVTRKDFLEDPLRWTRKASESRRVVVRDETGRVTAVIGGTLDYSPELATDPSANAG
jgi:hypothetical protein